MPVTKATTSRLRLTTRPSRFAQGLPAPVAVDEQKLCIGIGLAQGLGVDLVPVAEMVDQLGLLRLVGVERRPVDEASHLVLAEVPPSGDTVNDLFEQRADDPAGSLPLGFGEGTLEENVGGVLVLMAGPDLALHAQPVQGVRQKQGTRAHPDQAQLSRRLQPDLVESQPQRSTAP